MYEFSNKPVGCFLALATIFTLLFIPTAALSQDIDTVWYEDFEGDNWTDYWSVDAGTWEVGVPQSGPNEAYTGERLAATVLNGNYTEPVDSRLVRFRPFQVPSADQNPRLRFWHWFNFNADDWGVVQIKVENEEWVNISDSFYWYCSGAWTSQCIDLTAYAESTIQISFYFHSRESNDAYWDPDVNSGWYIDYVAVLTGAINYVNPENWESGLGYWFVDRGSWEIGIPDSGIGPNGVYGGIQCAATNLSGNYTEPAETHLISPFFHVPPADSFPHLTFWHWYSFSLADYGQVHLRTITGNWVSLSNQYTNTSGNLWTPPSLDMFEYADSIVQIGFFLYSRESNDAYWDPDVSSGWYIDNIRITGYPVNNVPDERPNVPSAMMLHPAYPNPFNSHVTIPYRVGSNSNSTIQLSIYDQSGRLVDRLNPGYVSAGMHSLTWDATGLPTGVYVVRLNIDAPLYKGGQGGSSQKVVLVK